MKTYNVNKFRMRYIVPFEVNIRIHGFEKVCKIVDTQKDYPYSFLGKNDATICGKWIREDLHRGEQDVYDYIVDEFNFLGEINFKNKIEKNGCFWHYSLFEENPFELEFSEGKNYSSSNRVYPISICDMGLYLFRSGIGLIWYEFRTEENIFISSSELIDFQNKIKELDRGHGNHLWIRGDKLDLDGEYWADLVPFMLGNWIAERLLFLDAKFQAKRNNSYASLLGEYYYSTLSKTERQPKLNRLYDALPKYCPDKALMFSYVVFEREKEWEKSKDSLKVAYYLTNGYKESYEMSEDIESTVRNPFANVYWVASREGCGYYAWQSDANSIFFTENQYTKIMNDYFLLYIRALYQSYSLMKYAVITSKILPNDYKVYVNVNDDTEKISKMIAEIEAEISLFIVKSVVTSVSHVHHQNEFYNYLIERLQIAEDSESVTVGLAALNELQHETLTEKKKVQLLIQQQEKEAEECREREADNTFQIGLGLMTFLAAISAVTDSYGIASALSNPEISTKWLIVFFVLFGFCLIILFTSLIIFIKSVRKLKRVERRNK